jgi:glycosyltransferase involved in cell wall biosynthesis
MNKWAGVDLLVKAFSMISRKDIMLYICGRGENDSMIEAIRADHRITNFGCVPENKLEELAAQSSLMVNPRDPALTENQMNFPSKILEYLSYCKPVISTWTDGLSPEYKKILVIADDASPNAIATKIEDVLGWSESQLSEYGRKVAAFLTSRKSWDIQVKRLMCFLNDIPTQSV